MAKIISIKKIPAFNKQKKKIVLAGGCFDILHPGHIVFLKKAKSKGDILIVFLESDQKIKQLKGINRPIHTQKERAQTLEAISYVDFIICLPFFKTDSEYDELIAKIKPDIIAATFGDEGVIHKKRVTENLKVKLIYVTKKISSHSTSRILGE